MFAFELKFAQQSGCVEKQNRLTNQQLGYFNIIN